MAAQRNAGRLPAARPYQRRTAPNVCGGLRIRPRANAAETPPQNPPSLRTAAARTAAAPARQTRHSRRFKSTRRDQRHDTIPSESRRALFHRFSPARRRYAGRLRGYAAHPLRSGGLRAVPRRRVGRRGGGARALFPAGADGHALRPTAAEAVRGKRRETPAALSAVRRSLLGGDGRLRAALPAAAVRLAVRRTAVLLPDRGLCSRCCCRCCSSFSFPRGCRRFGRSAG